jgi:hypothetical protein
MESTLRAASCLQLCGALLCGLACGGCGTSAVDSNEVATGDIYVDAVALAPGDGFTWIRARISVAGDRGLPIRLVASDQLLASLDDAHEEELDWVDDGLYAGRFARETAGRVRLALERNGTSEPATRARATLPEPFFLRLEEPDARRVRRGSPIHLSWQDPANGPIAWSVSGDCIVDNGGSLRDTGSLVIAPLLVQARVDQRGRRCEVQVTLERKNAGDFGGFTANSQFHASQRRAIRFVSVPGPGELDSDEIR